LIDSKNTNLTRSQVYHSLLEKGVQANVHFIPIHTHPFYQKKGFKKGDFPVAEWLYQNKVSLPMYYELSDAEQSVVIDALKKIFA